MRSAANSERPNPGACVLLISVPATDLCAESCSPSDDPILPDQESKDALALLREIGATWGETVRATDDGDGVEDGVLFWKMDE